MTNPDSEKRSEAVFVRVEDWEGLYIDDRLWSEGNSINLAQELDGRTVSFVYRGYNPADEEYTTNVGNLPDTFDELLDNQYMWEEDHRDD